MVSFLTASSCDPVSAILSGVFFTLMALKCIICISRLKHVNLVNMVGYSSDGQYPCLVYVYMSNGSLLDRLACLVSN